MNHLLQAYSTFSMDGIELDIPVAPKMLETLQLRGYAKTDRLPTYGRYWRSPKHNHLIWRLKPDELWVKCTALGIDVKDLNKYWKYIERGVLDIDRHPPSGVFIKDDNPTQSAVTPSRSISWDGHRYVTEGYEYDDDETMLRHVNLEPARRRAQSGVLSRHGKEPVTRIDEARRRYWLTP